MNKRRYEVYDVFTDKALAGNPLAVVLDAEGLDTHAMQAIAGEFNLSETIFVSPPQMPAHSASARIFTPRIELPFAGHPTVGAAICLYERDGGERNPSGAAILVLEEKIGAVRCAVSNHAGKPAFAEIDLPRLPSPIPLSAEPELVAAALGLDARDIDLENHRPSAWTAGVPYVCVPVRGLDAASRAAVNAEMWLEVAPRDGDILPSAYVYCRETVDDDTAFHARMFAPHDGILEDPATGSAAAAFAGAIHAFDAPVDGPNRYWIEQGIEMGRPSRIRLEIDIAQKAMTAARIGGHAVKVAEGVLLA
ncbi:PhzF family phenazine biosynthesis protein [Mesorhizobium xinjiangense]|uniref:PhzF family phenazine biosynthesis protein n=1 Tax=Mesorhizobium xinjiangense TaxID=2678685 RepID=UPI0012ED95B9|nr:PhzF family phenazine biosynthesis protein [Mesorhizobium xinjiangense]